MRQMTRVSPVRRSARQAPLRSVGLRPTGVVGVDLQAAGAVEGVELQLRVLVAVDTRAYPILATGRTLSNPVP